MADTVRIGSPARVVRRIATSTTVAALVVASLTASAPAAGDGNLDPSFSADGKVTTDFGGNDSALAIAVQGDGRIVVAGGASDPAIGFELARYRPDGTLDGTLSADGKQTTSFGSGTNGASAVRIQADGKIVAAGNAWPATSTTERDFALVRYQSNGALDTSFSGDGEQLTDFAGGTDFGLAATIQPDGKILVAGTAGTGPSPITTTDFALARYLPNGDLDAGFSGDGKVTTDFGTTDSAQAVALQPDGKIVVAGGSDSSFAVARYNSDGTPDLTFSGDGKLITAFAEPARGWSLVIQPDGKIVVAGQEGSSFALARYDTGGNLDPTFSGDGMQTTLVDPSGASGAFALARQSDGRLVAAGRVFVGSNSNWALARYNADGSLDPSFSSDGLVTADFGGFDLASALAIQGDGRIVAAGSANSDFGVARLRGPDRTVTIAVTGSKVHLRGRHASVKLTCPSSEVSPPCAGTLVLRTTKKVWFRGHHRRVVLASHRFSIGAGVTGTVRLHLSKRKAALLHHVRRARRVTAFVYVGDAAGNHATVVRRMKVVLH